VLPRLLHGLQSRGLCCHTTDQAVRCHTLQGWSDVPACKDTSTTHSKTMIVRGYVPPKTYLTQLVVQHHQLLASGPLRVVRAAHRLCSQRCTAVEKQRKQAYARLMAEQVMSQRSCVHFRVMLISAAGCRCTACLLQRGRCAPSGTGRNWRLALCAAAGGGCGCGAGCVCRCCACCSRSCASLACRICASAELHPDPPVRNQLAAQAATGTMQCTLNSS